MNIVEIISSEITNLFESGSMDKILTYDTDTVNYIRNLNNTLDSILDNQIFEDYDNVYLKGGAARLALQLMIDPNRFKFDNVRDIDLALIGDDYDNKYDFTDSIEKYGIEPPYYEGKSIVSYMKSRDVTLNEVILRPSMIAFTKRAYRDISRNIINLSYSKYADPHNNYNNDIGSRGLSRLILFSARYGYEIKFGLFDHYGDNNEYFNALLCLFKAFEVNVENRYFEISKKFKFANAENSNDYLDWLIYLLGNVGLLHDDNIENKILRSIKYYDGGTNIDKLFKFFPNIKKYIESLNYNDDDKEILKRFLKKPNRIN